MERQAVRQMITDGQANDQIVEECDSRIDRWTAGQLHANIYARTS